MSEKFIKVRPTPLSGYLANPHEGCCTFQRFNGEELNKGLIWSEAGPTRFPPPPRGVALQPYWPVLQVTPGYLPSTVAYCRWFWQLLEPKQGERDFSVIDQALVAASERGQTLALRVMAFGDGGQATLPDWYVERYETVSQVRPKGATIQYPVHDSPAYLEQWGGFIRELGRRYNGNPLIESIDITFIGPWGEGDGACSRAQCRRFAELWREAWPDTLRIALIAGDQMEEGIQTGAGWRCDCFGDLSARGSAEVCQHLSWNHQYDVYPFMVCDSGATDIWKQKPVHLECCWVPMTWYRQGWDIDFIIEQGLKFHASYFMPKSCAIPEPWADKLLAFCNRLGYRFVLRQASFESVGIRGQSFLFNSWIENVGVAPIYRRYDLAFRLRQGGKSFILPQQNIDIRTWMPGDVCLHQEINLPLDLDKGLVELSIGLIDIESRIARVRFAVKEQFADGWVPLGEVAVK